MPKSFEPASNPLQSTSFDELFVPLYDTVPDAPILESRGDRPLKMDFEHQLKALILFHLEEHKSARQLIQFLKEDDFARKYIAPPEGGIGKSSFSEAINSRGLEQLQFVYQKLSKKAEGILPKINSEFGELIAIDGTLINAVLSMYWADYRKGSKKAKAHFGFNLNHSIPGKIFLTEGTGAERPFVSSIIKPGQTGVMDRGYQSHKLFDRLQSQNKSFVCRIKASTKKKIIKENNINPDSIVFYDAEVILGSPGINLTEKSVRVVGYCVDKVKYWVATDKRDLSAEDIAKIYKLRWNIETFFAWWKRHLKVYHLIARSEYGLLVQIYGGLITYLLLAIYCHNKYNEKVSIRRVRELRNNIINETRMNAANQNDIKIVKEQQDELLAKT